MAGAWRLGGLALDSSSGFRIAPDGDRTRPGFPLFRFPNFRFLLSAFQNGL
jgi:hypothetical protein